MRHLEYDNLNENMSSLIRIRSEKKVVGLLWAIADVRPGKEAAAASFCILGRTQTTLVAVGVYRHLVIDALSLHPPFAASKGCYANPTGLHSYKVSARLTEHAAALATNRHCVLSSYMSNNDGSDWNYKSLFPKKYRVKTNMKQQRER